MIQTMIRILCLLLAFTAAFATEFPQRQRLEKAKPGDFVVYEANKTMTLLVIRSVSAKSMIIEEITATAPKNRPESWSSWLGAKAPGHTSWSMIEVDLEKREILECYSFSRSAWLPQSPEDSFLATLLHLPLSTVAADKQRKIGPAPPEGEPDRRQIWNPPLVVDGRKMEGITFDTFEAIWPKDKSELSGRTVTLYFDREGVSPLPCWIQVDTGNYTAMLRAIDSGHRLTPSPFRFLPRRVPEFVGSPVKTKSGLRLSIKSPKYYKEFELFAVDVTTRDKQIHLMSHSLVAGTGEMLNLEIEMEELNEFLQPNHQYTWIVVPTHNSGSYAELSKPFTWVP